MFERFMHDHKLSLSIKSEWGWPMFIIGENIRKLRKMEGLTQIEFAKQIGISQGTLSDIEQGNCNPSVDTALSIHSRFEIDLDWLLKGEQNNTNAGQKIASDFSVQEKQLFKLILKLNEEDQKELIKYVEFKLNRNK